MAAAKKNKNPAAENISKCDTTLLTKERLERAGCIIEQLFHVGSQYESDSLKSFFAMRSHADLEQIHEVFKDYKGKMLAGKHSINILTDAGFYGFIAEVDIPEQSQFAFDASGKVISYSQNPGISRVIYCSADTFENLIPVIEFAAAIEQQGFIEKWQKETLSKKGNSQKKK